MSGNVILGADMEDRFGRSLVAIIKSSNLPNHEIAKKIGEPVNTVITVLNEEFEMFYASDYIKWIMALGYDIDIKLKGITDDGKPGTLRLFTSL